MPDISGLELAAACKAIRPGFPAILCTGYSDTDPELTESARRENIDGILAKPIMLRDMATIIRTVLNGPTMDGSET